MKRIVVFLSFTLLSVSVMAQNKELCECHEWQLELAEQFKKEQSFEAMQKIKEENKDKIANCQKIVKAYEAKLAKMTEKEKKKEEKSYAKSCPAYTKIEKMKKQLEKAKK